MIVAVCSFRHESHERKDAKKDFSTCPHVAHQGFYTYYVCFYPLCITFHINILGSKIDLEPPSGLAWQKFVKSHHATFDTELALDLQINFPRFQVDLIFKFIITNEDENIPSRCIYLDSHSLHSFYATKRSVRLQIFDSLMRLRGGGVFQVPTQSHAKQDKLLRFCPVSF